jgi:hypothetical protein
MSTKVSNLTAARTSRRLRYATSILIVFLLLVSEERGQAGSQQPQRLTTESDHIQAFDHVIRGTVTESVPSVTHVLGALAQ